MKRSAPITAASLLALVVVLCAWLWWQQPLGSVDRVGTTHASESRGVPALALESASDAPVDASQSSAPKNDSVREPATTVVREEVVSVAGYVADAVNMRAVSGAALRFARKTSDGELGTSPTRGVGLREALTDREGVYEIRNLPLGSWRATIEAAGFRPFTSDISLPESLHNGRLDFRLCRPSVVRVELRTLEGQDLLKAAIDDPFLERSIAQPIGLVASQEIPRARLMPKRGEIEVDRSGRMHSPGDHGTDNRAHDGPTLDRYFEFPEPLPMYLSVCFTDIVLETEYVEPDRDTVRLTIPLELLRAQMHRVRVRVLDADNGEPLKSAKVALLFISQATGGGGVSVDNHGDVFFEHRPPGLWTLSISAPEYEWIHEGVRVEAEGDTDLGTYRLAHGISIEGTIGDDRGAPVPIALALVPLEGPDPSKEHETGIAYAPSKSGDHFAIHRVGRKKQVLRAGPLPTRGKVDEHWTFKPVMVDTTNGSKRDLAIHCVVGTHVVFHATSATTGELRIVDLDGLPVTELMASDRYANECYLAPGSYSAQLRSGGKVISTTRFAVGASEQNVDLESGQ